MIADPDPLARKLTHTSVGGKYHRLSAVGGYFERERRDDVVRFRPGHG